MLAIRAAVGESGWLLGDPPLVGQWFRFTLGNRGRVFFVGDRLKIGPIEHFASVNLRNRQVAEEADGRHRHP